jgi:UDP-GlcNAc:undecaprenyl-phosphate/decaprenyl-phosphate GlcNAc-1-phosphate transferase
MLTYLVAFLLSLAIAAITTPLIARYATRNQWGFDLPTDRKIHTHPIPRVGGLAVAAAFFAPLFGLAVYTNRVSDLLYADSRMFAAFCVGAFAILGLGIYDDLKGADAKLKLSVQASIALMLWFSGFRIELLGNPFGETIQLDLLSLPLTLLWIVGVINALNLIDGLDGLASGIGIFTCVVLFGVAFLDGAVILCLIATALGGALIGFLFFNFNPARIFLGDSGSMLLGFVLATISVWTQRKGATAAALLVPAMALGVPILDTTLSFVRRVLRRQNPFKADREHIHHRLLAIGLSHRDAVYTLYTVSAIFGLGALAMLRNDVTERAIVLSAVGLVGFILMRKIGLVAAPSLFSSQESARAARDAARVAARAIRNGDDLESVWQEVVRFLESSGSEEVRLSWDLPAVHSERRKSVFHWRANGSKDWLLSSIPPRDARIYRIGLEESGVNYGEIEILRRKSRPSFQEEVAFQLICDALIDFSVGATSIEPADAGTIVHLQRDVATR